MIVYLTEAGLETIFRYVAERYARIEEVPQYREERTGFEKLCGVLTQAQSDSYYPTVLEKAVYLLIGINKGHFFSNGNKRLALAITLFFLRINKLRLGIKEKTWYRKSLQELFSEYQQWGDFEDFTSTDFATYNLSIMIAESGVYGISHDELKRRVLAFLEVATEPVSE